MGWKPEETESRWGTVRECSGARTAGLGPRYPLASADFIVDRAGRGEKGGNPKRSGTGRNDRARPGGNARRSMRNSPSEPSARAGRAMSCPGALLREDARNGVVDCEFPAADAPGRGPRRSARVRAYCLMSCGPDGP